MAAPTPAAVSAPAAKPATVSSPPPAVTGDVWDRVRAAASGQKLLATILADLTCLGVREGVARLVGPREMVHAARMKLADIESLFRQVTGGGVRVQIESATAEVREPLAGDASPLAAPPRAPIQEHPLVRQAIDELGATLVRVQPRVKPPGAS